MPPITPQQGRRPCAPCQLPSPGPLHVPAAAFPAGGMQGGCARAPSPPCLPSALAAGAGRGAAGAKRHFFQELLPAFPSPSQRPAVVPGSSGGSWGQGEGSARTGPSWDPALATALLASPRQYFPGSVGKERLASPIFAGAPSRGRVLLPSTPHCPISPVRDQLSQHNWERGSAALTTNKPPC